MINKNARLRMVLLMLMSMGPTTAISFGQTSFRVDFWYGKKQTFGAIGHPQRWINILGHVSPADEISDLQYRLDGGTSQPLGFQESPRRIRATGDFNIEIDRSLLTPGQHTVTVVVRGNDGNSSEDTVSFVYMDHGRAWPLPYEIKWAEVKKIQDVAQVVDGDWVLTDDGIRTVHRHYDRVIAFGDDSWRDYEVKTTVTVHDITAPKTGLNTTNVTHAAIALRWPGHHPDGKQPSIQWYPLGATAEFRLGSDLSDCRWRIFDERRSYHMESDRRRRLNYDQRYAMKHRVRTLNDGTSEYSAKLWHVEEREPKEWDLVRVEPDNVSSGSALILAHFADVTFADISVVPVKPSLQRE